MSLSSECLAISYAEFVQLYEAGRISTHYTIADSVDVPIANLLARKAAMLNPPSSAMQGDWERAAQLRENAMIARLADVDYIYLHLCIDPDDKTNYQTVTFDITSECGGHTTRHFVVLDEKAVAPKVHAAYRPILETANDEFVI